MPRVRFHKSHEHPLSSIETKCFDAGWEGEVSDEIAEKAIKLGKATAVAVAMPAAEDEAAGAAPAPKSAKGKGKPAAPKADK